MTEDEHRAMYQEIEDARANVERIKRELRDHGALAYVIARMDALDVGELVNDIGQGLGTGRRIA